MKRVLSVALISTLIWPILVWPVAAQQSVPQGAGDPLRDICTGFMEQSGQAVAGDRDKLCACLVRETQTRLTLPEMEAYARATEAGQTPSPEVMQKVIGIAATCLAAR